ncbi:AAA family ATPase [Methylovulum psychrotolerans]|uniref:ATP/GTP-binding protein n=1 Tax=Methylovulum psychrotolerans TaxID=1704499 RepID=A0A2S5CGA0_9GAMM|nr:AAA family ATPase [Methylovulum psychrotolerans]POZ49826.1 ATP/GTP-binding protein [Methylovulum psychrotolerans]
MNTSPIKSFSVYGLFGTSDVHIPFDENIKILVGENGLGKTQVLNILYYTLTQNFLKLSEFYFERLVLRFSESDADAIEINIENIKIINKSVNWSSSGVAKRVGAAMAVLDKNNSSLTHPVSLKASHIKHQGKIHTAIYELKAKTKIQSGISGKDILYFPTFRRVEEDLHNLGYDEQDERLNQEDTVIQFGMDDVSRKFASIENKIDSLLKEGFAKISSEILSQLVKGFSETDNRWLDTIDQNALEIILARVGKQLPEEDKTAMRAIVADKKETNPSLMYFLKKLLEIYDTQKTLDNSVKQFRDVCNKYLVGKQLFYDESAIKIFVKSDITDAAIELKYLSSGEKQIISMFAKIYLAEEGQRFIVLFDEPELSLSMPWQKQLLPDMINSTKCDFLLAVTHSPFIFDNELDRYAVGLSEYITRTKQVAA